MLRARFERPAVLLHPVSIHARREVAEPVLRGDGDALPDLSLLELAVAEEDVRLRVEPAPSSAECDPDAERESLTERACRRVEPGQTRHVGMPLEAASRGVERRELLDREVAAQRHDRVERDRGVALREDE